MAKAEITVKGLEGLRELKSSLETLRDAFEIGADNDLMTTLFEAQRAMEKPEPKTHGELVADWLSDGNWDGFTTGDFIAIDPDTGELTKADLAIEMPVGIYTGDTNMAKRKTKTVSPFKKGRATRRTGGGQFVGVKEGEPLTFAPLVGLDEMVSADMHEYWDIRPAIYHPCIGRNCPGCQVGNEPRFKAYLPILLQSGETAVYPFTISVYNQLEALEDSLEDDESLAGFAVKVSRKGTGMATRYTVLGLGKRLDVSKAEMPDFISSLGPQSEKDIWELLENNGFSREDVTTAESDEADDGDGWGAV